jgi:hypothetical protein
MIVVPGLSLKNLQPRVWDPKSEFFLPRLNAVMVSYADFHQMGRQREQAMEAGLHEYLGVPETVRIYLDNGAFYFLGRSGTRPHKSYERFVEKARPDWWPVPQDYIPSPSMPFAAQRSCYEKTMCVNKAYKHDGYVPVAHIGTFLSSYTRAISRSKSLGMKPRIALGGIVPNLLRSPNAYSYGDVLKALLHTRKTFADKDLHVFGIGGTATLHIAALLGVNSVDSSGWRNRAARGLVQLPGTGDRMVANLGSWRGRELSDEEWQKLQACPCPGCGGSSRKRLRAKGIKGFTFRAAHNLWILLEEAHWLDERITGGTYGKEYATRLDNTVYLPLIKKLQERCGSDQAPGVSRVRQDLETARSTTPIHRH